MPANVANPILSDIYPNFNLIRYTEDSELATLDIGRNLDLKTDPSCQTHFLFFSSISKPAPRSRLHDSCCVAHLHLRRRTVAKKLKSISACIRAFDVMGVNSSGLEENLFDFGLRRLSSDGLTGSTTCESCSSSILVAAGRGTEISRELDRTVSSELEVGEDIFIVLYSCCREKVLYSWVCFEVPHRLCLIPCSDPLRISELKEARPSNSELHSPETGLDMRYESEEETRE
ncbi:uncharacterized protein MYCFIDRAFT_171517 [Pseudocercospora fijiensis CIRAD86]|uniref:Uncharacterized protein n=1 Tax=Pseudocercospora fijiensis (strain CIRAD86) TaxID=383855 RepID=M3B8H4_PSEFD|nr:uncharacterized protein MYCFIDRAFT_171517 [Pseudocercospora fijiensis CIRAD86]EME85627.1 hypothetical protein MYCFIDRAFT_171517 [Pseudocercospora fijiensis CIRAD86]